MNVLIGIGCAATIFAIVGWVAWHSLDDVLRLGLMDIDMKGDDGFDD